jgi:hypothetical protein
MAKKLSDYIPILKDQGIDYIAAAPAAGVATQYQVITISGAPQIVTLDHEMANASYAVCGSDVSGGVLTIGTKTVSTVEITTSSGTAECNLIIVGQLKGQK